MLQSELGDVAGCGKNQFLTEMNESSRAARMKTKPKSTRNVRCDSADTPSGQLEQQITAAWRKVRGASDVDKTYIGIISRRYKSIFDRLY